eukprot:CAMPEP_0114675442 /NCGR_PEP_ID=MMETSP0191-20121206/47889_1 /TAXON_ID=126664 /ORGANISM="Sorites sp." /LENGTH=39 /DNA_ID= /DNA_START= /DNA_END= /DNA_ORIENTATION=
MKKSKENQQAFMGMGLGLSGMGFGGSGMINQQILNGNQV